MLASLSVTHGFTSSPCAYGRADMFGADIGKTLL
ncbi:MAG: hypothetical protein R3B93_28135 [Bacteroidia bacterium]